MSVTRQDIAIELERRRFDSDARYIYRALQWYIQPPDWSRACDPRVMTLYTRAYEIEEAKRSPVVPWHLREKGPDYKQAAILAERYTRATGSSAIDCRLYCLFITGRRLVIDVKAKEAWKRRCTGIEYPLSDVEVKHAALHSAHLLWDVMEEAATGQKKKVTSASEWANKIESIVLDKETRNLRPVSSKSN